MANVVLYQEALARGQFKADDYFQVTYPGGKKTLWRLNKPLEGLMWGPPTEEKIYLKGKKGYDNFFDLADKRVKKEYSFPEVFSNVQACGSRETYKTYSIDEWEKVINDVEKFYCQHPDDKNLQPYFLVSRCIIIGRNRAYFYVFVVSSGSVYARSLYDSNGIAYSYSFAVRPEAIPNPSSYIQMEGCDGSKQKPYILLGSTTHDKGEHAAIYTEESASSVKDEL